MNKSLLLAIPIFFVFFGCVSFDSAVSTGKIGQSLAEYNSMYKETTTICDYLQLLDEKSFPKDYCKSYSSQLKKMTEGLTMLSTYGAALEKIAKGSEFNSSEKLDLMIKGGESMKWFKIEDDSEEGIKKISGSVTKLTTNTIKRKGLKKIVKEVNEPLQNLINTILIPELNNRKKLYSNLNIHLKHILENESRFKPDMRMIHSNSTASSDTLFAHYNDLDMLLTKKFEALLQSDIKATEAYEKSLKAFALAHQKLANEADKIGTKKDAEVANDIWIAVKEIYLGLEKF